MALKNEKNWLEKIADAVPGLSGYQKRETRRETDKRLREYLARRLDECARDIEHRRDAHFKSAGLKGLDEYGTVLNNLSAVADSLRFASYGYSGAFDLVKIKDDQIDELYRYDIALMDNIEQIGSKKDAPLGEVSKQIEVLREKVVRRKDIFEKFSAKEDK